MKDYIYVIYVLVLGVVSFFTGEIVTFIMLGIILMALTNMLRVQKEILKKLSDQNSKDKDERESNQKQVWNVKYKFWKSMIAWKSKQEENDTNGFERKSEKAWTTYNTALTQRRLRTLRSLVMFFRREADSRDNLLCAGSIIQER